MDLPWFWTALLMRIWDVIAVSCVWGKRSENHSHHLHSFWGGGLVGEYILVHEWTGLNIVFQHVSRRFSAIREGLVSSERANILKWGGKCKWRPRPMCYKNLLFRINQGYCSGSLRLFWRKVISFAYVWFDGPHDWPSSLERLFAWARLKNGDGESESAWKRSIMWITCVFGEKMGQRYHLIFAPRQVVELASIWAKQFSGKI